MIDKVKAEEMGQHHTLNMILDDQEGMKVELKEADTWWPNLCVDCLYRLYQICTNFVYLTLDKTESYHTSFPII